MKKFSEKNLDDLSVLSHIIKEQLSAISALEPFPVSNEIFSKAYDDAVTSLGKLFELQLDLLLEDAND